MNLFQGMRAVRRNPCSRGQKELPFPSPWHSRSCYQYSTVQHTAVQCSTVQSLALVNLATQLSDSLPVWIFPTQKWVFMRYCGIAWEQRAKHFEFRAFSPKLQTVDWGAVEVDLCATRRNFETRAGDGRALILCQCNPHILPIRLFSWWPLSDGAMCKWSKHQNVYVHFTFSIHFVLKMLMMYMNVSQRIRMS